jgi:hypothetical protein
MPANTAPIFTLTPICDCVAIATINTARDGTGTIGTVSSAGANGTRYDAIHIKATVTTTAGCVRLFVYTGSTYFLLEEINIPAITVSATQPAYSTTYYFPGGLTLPTGYSIRASTEKGENFNVIAVGGSF